MHIDEPNTVKAVSYYAEVISAQFLKVGNADASVALSLKHKDFVVGEAELLTAEGDVADAVGLLHFAGGDAALMADSAYEEGLAIFTLAAREGARRNVGAAGWDPVGGAANEYL